MGDNKAFCVNCLNLVNPQTHHDCTLTFDNVLAADERVGTENFQQAIGAATLDQPQIYNPRMLEGGIEDKSLLSRKPDFANHKLPAQNPPEKISSNIDPTSPPVLRAHNPAVQPAGSTDYGNGYFYGVAQAYYPTNPLYPHYFIGQQMGQMAIGSVQQENEIPNAMTENNERNRPHQEYPQSSYGQNFARNTLPLHTVPAFSKPVYNNSIIAYGHEDYQPYMSYQQPQNQYTSYEPQTTMETPNNNKGLGNYALNLKTSPISPEPNGAFRSDNITMNKEKDLFAQNKLSSNCLVSKSEIPSENGVEVNKAPNRFTNNYSQRTRRKTADKSVLQKNTESSAHLKKEMWSTPQTNVKRGALQKKVEGYADQKNEKNGTPQKKMEQSIYQTNEVKSLPENYSVKNVLQKDAETSLQENGTKKGAHIKDVDEGTNTEEGVHATAAEKGAKEKDEKEGAPVANTDKGAQATDAEKGSHATDAENGAYAANADMGVHAANVDKGAPTANANKGAATANADKSAPTLNAEKDAPPTLNAEKDAPPTLDAEKDAHATGAESVQENEAVFTGEGYKSIEEFIAALYNGTLYKRY